MKEEISGVLIISEILIVFLLTSFVGDLLVGNWVGLGVFPPGSEHLQMLTLHGQYV